MRTLNRPMFRYGGPIKEGVMNGIREPKKNGGSMGEPQAVNTVGSPLAPMGPDGRARHALPLLAPLAFQAARFALRPLGQLAMRQIAKRGVTGGGGIMRSGLGRSRVMQPGESLTRSGVGFTPNKYGKYFLNSPEAKFITGAGGKASKFVKGALKTGAKSPLTVAGLTYSLTDAFPGGRPLGPDKYLRNILGQKYDEEGRVKGTGINALWEDEVDTLTTSTDTTPLTDAEKAAITKNKKAQAEAAKLAQENFAKAQKEKRIQGYREIMDIKGMNKDATYKSLIDASTAIQNEGDFKGSIKDGSLINKLIRSTSKNFDKVTDTKKAINSLILKGEIEKDINQGKDGSQMKAAKDFAAAQGISVTEAYKSLGFSKNKNLSENIAIVSKSQGGIGLTTDSVTEGIRMTYPELGVPQVVFTDAELIDQKKKNPLYKNANEAAIFEDFAVKNELGNGVYVLGTTAFTLTDGKLVQLR